MRLRMLRRQSNGLTVRAHRLAIVVLQLQDITQATMGRNKAGIAMQGLAKTVRGFHQLAALLVRHAPIVPARCPVDRHLWATRVGVLAGMPERFGLNDWVEKTVPSGNVKGICHFTLSFAK